MKSVFFFLSFLFVTIALAQPAIPGFTTLGAFGGKFYYASATGMDWYSARDTCIVHGGTLACIGSAEENAFLAANTQGMGSLWLGFTDVDSEAVWTWVNGDSVTYTNWYPGEPNNFYNNEDFALFDWGANGSWADAGPSYGARILLEMPGILPIELTTFTATGDFNRILLNWRTESEQNNAYFKLNRYLNLSDTGTVVARITGAGNSALPSIYNYIDSLVQPGTTYYYRLSHIAFDSSEQILSDTVSAVAWYIPAQIVEFQAITAGNQIELNWRSETETNNASYTLYRSTSTDSGFSMVTSIASHAGPSGNSATPQEYTYFDTNCQRAVTYYYRISAITLQGDEYHYPLSATATIPPTVVLSSFQATGGIDQIRLNWRTESEYNNHQFRIYRSLTETGADYIVSVVSSLATNGNSTTPLNYSHTDSYNIVAGQTYYYRLSSISLDGEEFLFPQMTSATPLTNAVTENLDHPLDYRLSSVYPNPFNPTTMISYSLRNSGMVELSVYNEIGQRVALLVHKHQAANHYRVHFNATGLPSGTYYYSLKTPGFSCTRQMMLVK